MLFPITMKQKQYLVPLGLLALVTILCVTPEITMTSSAQSAKTYGCTASNPCVNICGDHVCAPGELAQMKAQSNQAQMGNKTTSSAPSTSTPTSPSMGTVIAGKLSYVDQASDGTIVVVRTGHPLVGQPLDIIIGFMDSNRNFVQHQNYAITVTQDNNTVLSNPTGHTHTGTDTQTTSALSSTNPVDIQVTLNGVGLPTADPSTWTGVKGEVLTFSKVYEVQAPTTVSNMTITTQENTTVPEFGQIASIILVIAILGVVFVTKTRVIPRL